ncbi:TetR/AcrR family transcriptional regulator [Flagellimonas sp. GZD32]|uniref:TetR/AcrR family transcriptional regulator n=1 Tax=Flagellimonas cixiensis TaxID=3228750 RepID=UPI0035C93EFA
MTSILYDCFSFTTMNKKTKRDFFQEETLKLIYEKGFKATTMRDIAQRLDFEVGNVYNYIDSKQSLLDYHLFDIQNEFIDSMGQILASSFSPKEKLRQVISSYIQISSNRPYEQAMVVNEWRNLKESRLKEFHEGRTKYERSLQRIIQNGIEQGDFENRDVEITTQTIMAALRWIYTLFIDPKDKINPIEVEKQLTDFIFGGTCTD